MKNYFNLARRGRLLLLMLFALLAGGVSPAWADAMALPYSYGFEDYNLANDGWTTANPSGLNNSEFAIVGAAKNTGSYGFRFSSYNDKGENTQYLISPEFNAPNGINVSFYYKASYGGGSEKFKVGYSTSDTDVANFTWDEEISVSSTSWLLYENSFPAGTKYVAIYYYSNYQYRLFVDDFSFTAPISGPALAVADGSTTINSGYNYDFGLTTAGATHYFILSNPGTESITMNIAATNGFGVSNSSLTLNAKASSLLTVTMADATASGTVTITPTASEVDPFVINVSGTLADPNKVYETLLTGSIPEGWTTSGTWSWSTTNGASNTAYYESYNYRLITPKLTVAEGETFYFDARGTYSGYQGVKFEYSADGTNWTASGTTTTLTSDWQTFTISDIPAGQYYIALHGWQCNLRNFYGGQLPDGANFAIDTDGTTQNFGVAAIGGVAQKTFTITNSGNAALSVTITGTADFSVNNTNLTVPAKSGDTNGTATFTVSMSTATAGVKSGNIELAFDALNASSFTIPVSGVVMPAGATVVDFNDNALPAGWGNNASYKWSFADGKAYCTSAAELTTSKLQFEEGDFFVISATSYDDYDNNYLEIYTSTDGTTWETNPIKKFVSRSQIPYGSYASLVVTDIPTTVKFLKFKGYYVRIDEITGLKSDANDPRISVTTFALPNPIPVASGTLKDFGWSNTNVEALYFISNSGTGTLTISDISVPDGFTAGTTGNAMTVAAGADPLTLIVTMTSGVVGPLGGTVTLTTDGGNFEIPVKGFVYGDKNLVDFTNASQYQGWTGVNVTDNAATLSSTAIETTPFAATAGEKLYVEIKGNSSYTTHSFSYSYSRDGGATWSNPTALVASTYGIVADQVFTITDIADAEAASNVKIRFTGAGLSINRIYGFTAVPTAVMETTAADIAFGTQTAESVEQTFTISNIGTADLTGLSVTLAKTGEDAEYSFRMTDSEDAEFTGSTLAAGATITVYVKQLFDINKLGPKSDVLTIAATDQIPVAINLSGTTNDPSILYVDFNSSSLWPAEILEHGASWTIYNYNGSGEARQGSTTTATSLTLTPLTVASTEDKLTFDVAYHNNSGSRELTVSYTTDGGLTWADYNWGTSEEPVYDLKQSIGYSYATQTITGIPAGTVVFRFTGKSIKLDNISGDMRVTTAPLITLTDEDNNIVVNNSTKDFGNLKADGVAVYTLKNIGNAPIEPSIIATGVGSAVFENPDEGVILDGTANATIPAGKGVSIKLTVPFKAPYGNVSGTLKIYTQKAWMGDVFVNYTANLVDPADFFEDFAGNAKPAGWFSENWVYDGGTVHLWYGNAKPIITEKIGAEASSDRNVLKFDAKINTGTDEQTLNVYTSTDRKTWSEAQSFTLNDAFQSFELTPLADGEYYVKFESVNAMIDNITGVKKLALPEHDLYLVSATLPTDEVTPNKAVSATINVASLITTETVDAQLYFGENIIGVLTGQEVTTSATKAITISGYAPVAGTYDVYAKVYNGDVAIETDKVSVTVADTRKLEITGFDAVKTSVQADDDNQFTATFNVEVQNTGSTPLAAADVSVTLTDTSDPAKTFTATLSDVTTEVSELQPSETFILPVIVSGAAGKGATFTYTATENVSGTSFIFSRSVNVTPTTVDIAIGEYGYATFASQYALDLDELPDGLEVFYVTADNVHANSIGLTEATGLVKEGTGLLLKGAQDNYTLYATKKSDAQELTGNLLVGCVAETVLEQNANFYVLSVGEGDRAEFQSLANQGATIPAGKAYLNVPGAGARLIINFDDVTGIDLIDNGKRIMDHSVYNLQGQKVESVKKGGLYIMNGKKVVIK